MKNSFCLFDFNTEVTRLFLLIVWLFANVYFLVYLILGRSVWQIGFGNDYILFQWEGEIELNYYFIPQILKFVYNGQTTWTFICNSRRDIVSINVNWLWYWKLSQTHYDVANKNNNVRFQDLNLQNRRYSIFIFVS